MPAALHDLTVLDLSQGIAGPMTAMLLADQGARVLKIEPPGGDPTRALSGARVWHRGKESIVLDLRGGEGRANMERLWQLIQRADVLIESAEPGAPDHPGLTYARAQRHNPRLVYCAITAYGGLARHAGRPPHDALVAARTGLQWEARGWPGGSIERVNGVEPFLPDLPIPLDEMEGPPRPGPLYSSVPWPSVSAFHLASMGIGAALHARERTGQGCHVTTSLLQGALVNGTFTWQRVAHPDRPGYRMWVTDPRVPHGFFRTSDGRWVHNWTPQPGFVLNAIHEGKLEPNVSGRSLKFDGSRVGMDPSELLVLRELTPAMQDAFGQFSSDEWVAAAAEAGVSIQPIRSTEEAFADPLFLDDGCVVEVKDPDVGLIRHVGLSIHMAATPGCVRGPAPRVGDDTDLVLAELTGASDSSGTLPPAQEVAAAEPAHAWRAPPLRGITVLDLGLAVAGPFGTQMLADFGADVIKVNQPSDQTWMNMNMGMCCNRGKRSVSLNLKTAQGMEVFRALVARADVVHTNMRYDAVEHLGVDYESLRQVNPRLIYCHTRGFENGPRMLLPGHDQSASALTGVAWEEGGVGAGGKPIWPNISLGDMGNGMLSATAVLHALFHRDRTGEGQLVTTSIVYAHLLNNSTRWVDAEGRAGDAQLHLDALALGVSALARLYPCAEGWICIAAHGHWPELAGAVGRPDLTGDPRFATAEARTTNDADLVAALEPLFATRTAAEWAEALAGANVPAEISSETFSLALFDDAELAARGWISTVEQALVGTFEAPGDLVSFSGHDTVDRLPPLVVGSHTREILAWLGYDGSAVDELILHGVATES
jgi:crotonobetainyl-CoA:carnitine CoA-transferase CaiB-like acyl-CoA transferase